jgi:hypothetical protein
MGPEQLIKTATGQRRRRLRDEARSRRQWRHLCCDRAGCWPSAGAPGVSGAAQWLAFRSPPLPSLGLSSFVGGVITRYGPGLSGPKMTSVAATTNSPGLSIPIPARGQLVDSGGNILAIGLLHAWFNASEQMSGVPAGGSTRGHDHAHTGCDGDRPLPGHSVPGGFGPSVVADPATMLGP